MDDVNTVQGDGVGIFLCGFARPKRRNHDALARLAVVDVLPEFFGDEGHERMQELQQRVEERQGLLVRLVVYRLSVGRLDHFEVPTGELVPE